MTNVQVKNKYRLKVHKIDVGYLLLILVLAHPSSYSTGFEVMALMNYETVEADFL
jgi:hypothetical protein